MKLVKTLIFSTSDLRKFSNVTYVCKAWEIIDYVPENSVSEIYSRHFLEHLTWAQVDLTLSAWYKILKPGGTCQIIVPDMLFHIKQWMNPNRKTTFTKRTGDSPISDEEWGKKGFFGGQRGSIDDIWDIHKSGYDLNLITDLLSDKGFEDIKRLKGASKNLDIVCSKGFTHK